MNYGKFNPTMQWTLGPEPDLAGYIIHYRRDDQATLTNVDVGLVNSYVMSGLGPYQRWYYFSLSAYDTSGNRSDRTSELEFYISDKYTKLVQATTIARKGL